MKKNVTYIDQAKFETIARGMGLGWLEQAGFIKVSGAEGRNVYVARTKRVGRVDVSGFTVELEGVRTLTEGESFGAVAQQLDFSRTEEQVLATFEALLGEMAMLGPRARQPRKQLEPKADPKAAKPGKDHELIARVAREKGASVSPAAQADSSSQEG